MRREYLVIFLIALVVLVTIGITLGLRDTERQTEIANIYVRLMTDCTTSSGRSMEACTPLVVGLLESETETIIRCHRQYPPPDAAFIACIDMRGIDLPY
ncbi:hypothetical protein FBR02_12365 [Anaerolineae bacterium CFX9]|nr:hypothetical protein [Anaerolineae bacterium CFX9]